MSKFKILESDGALMTSWGDGDGGSLTARVSLPGGTLSACGGKNSICSLTSLEPVPELWAMV